MINLLSKTDDFINNDKFSWVKPMILWKMINSLSKPDDSIKTDKFSVKPMIL